MTIPLWVMIIGALGISIGLILFGPKLIRMVGEQITKLNPMRAYCFALSAAVTVIIPSRPGFPVSSTHITVGAVFGVGFFREWYTARSKRRGRCIERKPDRASKTDPTGESTGSTNDLTGESRTAVVATDNGAEFDAKRRKLVRRTHFTTIVAAWVITVPAVALLAAVFFTLLTALTS